MGEAPCTAASVMDVIGPEDTKPMKLLTVLPEMVCVVVPLPSVAVSVTSPAVNRPLMLLLKKLPPMPRTVLARPLKVMLSVAMLVDNQGSAAVPAPKNVDVLALACRRRRRQNG